jgi:NAD(P)-dependent dehydrogenase (short-subunit alcohol dehydrogenase family)
MPVTPRLEGKVAIVTGATRGIGLAIVAALVEQGVDVIGTARTDEHVKEARERVAAAGATATGGKRGRFEVRIADVRDYASVERTMSAAADLFGGLDILVNNAGIGSFGEVAAQPLEQWRDTIDTNLTGVFHGCRAAIPHLRRRGGGWIVNISSLAAKNPFAGAAAYCATKAGLNAFSEALMQEVRYDDIRVSCILPGSVRTEFAGTHDGVGTEWKLAPEDVARAVVDLLMHDPRSLPSRVEIRPSKPRK